MIRRNGKNFEVNGKVFKTFEEARAFLGIQGELDSGNMDIFGNTVDIPETFHNEVKQWKKTYEKVQKPNKFSSK